MTVLIKAIEDCVNATTTEWRSPRYAGDVLAVPFPTRFLSPNRTRKSRRMTADIIFSAAWYGDGDKRSLRWEYWDLKITELV